MVRCITPLSRNKRVDENRATAHNDQTHPASSRNDHRTPHYPAHSALLCPFLELQHHQRARLMTGKTTDQGIPMPLDPVRSPLGELWIILDLVPEVFADDGIDRLAEPALLVGRPCFAALSISAAA
jgi:hypothetical protein